MWLNAHLRTKNLRSFMKTQLIAIFTLLVSSIGFANPAQYSGKCVSLATGQTEASQITLDFTLLPMSLKISNKDGTSVKAEYKKPTKVGKDLQIVLDSFEIIPEYKLNVITYGSFYTDKVEQFESVQSFTFHANTTVSLHQFQRMTSNGQSITSNEMNCEYK
jgi:hypothetical protein